MSDAETHFMKHTPRSDRPESVKGIKLWLGNTQGLDKKKTRTVREHKNPYKNITPQAVAQLSDHFRQHVERMLSRETRVPILALVYTSELIGAEAAPIHLNSLFDPEQQQVWGVVINETKNTMAIHIRGATRIYPKAMYNYAVKVAGSTYFLLGRHLKYERRYEN